MSHITTPPAVVGSVAPAPPVPAVVQRKKTQPKGAWSSKLAVNVMLTLFCLYTLLPLTWLVIASTKSTSDLYGTGGFAFADFNLIENLVTLFTWEGGTFLRWLANTGAYAILGACASVAVSFLAGHAFDKFDFPGKERWFGFVLVGVLVPAAVTTMPLPAALGIYSWHGRTLGDPEYAQLVVVGSLVTIILFISLQRFWKSGLGAGALK